MIPGVVSSSRPRATSSDPVITSPSSVSVLDGDQLAHALTADVAVTWAVTGGVDSDEFEISGSTLRWLSNGTRDFSSPQDADVNNVYEVQVTATSDDGEDVQSISVEVEELVWTTVYEPPGTEAFELDTSDCNTRALVWTTDLTGDGATKVRVTFFAPVGAGMDIQHASIGVRTSNASFTSPVALEFGGNPGHSLSAGQEVTSDPADFTFLQSDTLLVAVDHGAASSIAGISGVSMFGGYYTKSEPSDETMTPAPSGYSALGGGRSWGVSKIEVA